MEEAEEVAFLVEMAAAAGMEEADLVVDVADVSQTGPTVQPEPTPAVVMAWTLGT